MHDDLSFLTEKDLTQKLGEGGYGAVYKFEKHAVKRIEFTAKKPCSFLAECIILSSLKHPYIISCKQIFRKENSIFIVQELAYTDMAILTRRNQKSLILSVDQLRDYAWQILKALEYLHSNEIIHADVKASNVFLMEDLKTIKLGDFSVSVSNYLVKQGKRPAFKHRVGTNTHKAPEIWLEKEWQYSIDIWSTGCTFFEMAYGDNLFPNQSNAKKIKNAGAQKAKTLIKEKTLNVLYEWMQKTNQINPWSTAPATFYKYSHISYHHIKLPSSFYYQAYEQYNSLMLSCLQIDPALRPNATQLLLHPFFKNPSSAPSQSQTQQIGTQVKYMDHMHYAYAQQQTIHTVFFPTVEFSEEILSYATYLYHRSIQSSALTATYTTQQILIGCLQISYRLLMYETLSFPESIKDIQPHELIYDICHVLQFQIL